MRQTVLRVLFAGFIIDQNSLPGCYFVACRTAKKSRAGTMVDFSHGG
jgi:hypothetical protein